MLPVPHKKNVIFLDAETFYDNDYSLRKMPTPNYILDPRFELQLMAVKVNDGPHDCIEGPDFPLWLSQFDPAVTTTVTFNTLFDQSILAWRYGWVPHTMIDVMGMARALLGHELVSFSLRSIADYLHLGSKGTALANMKGKRLEQIRGEGLLPSFKQYATQDNFLCEQIFLQLYPQFPWSERRLMDMVLRCCIEPRFRCDVPLLEQHLIDVQAAKAQLLVDANNIDPKLLMSTPKFGETRQIPEVRATVELPLALDQAEQEPPPDFRHQDDDGSWGCKEDGCEGRSRSRSGPYAYLCDEHSGRFSLQPGQPEGQPEPGMCKIAGCDQPALFKSGTYARLCEQHRADRRAALGLPPSPDFGWTPEEEDPVSPEPEQAMVVREPALSHDGVQLFGLTGEFGRDAERVRAEAERIRGQADELDQIAESLDRLAGMQS